MSTVTNPPPATTMGDRIEAAYSRTRPATDDTAYLERRLGELEIQARIRR